MKKSRNKPKPLPGGHPRFWTSMSQCGAAMNVTEGVVARWKRKGCPAFRHHRIYSEPLLTWRASHPDADEPTEKEKLQCQLLKMQIKTAALDYHEREESLVEWSEVRDWIRESARKARSILLAELLPLGPKLEGLRAPYIAKEFERVMPDIFHKLRHMHPEEATKP